MTNTRDFHIGDILSITHDRLISPRHMDGIYDILNFMTGDQLFTHQLPRAAEECEPFLLAQHPDLKDVDVSDINADNWKGWLADLEAKYGKTRPVAPILTDAHKRINPITELQDMVGKDRVIPVVMK